MRRAVIVATVAVVAVALSASGQERRERWWHLYLQQSFPKQTTTNDQIEQINRTFGVNFDTWDDVVNLSVGTQLFWRVSPHLKVGGEFDFSAGQIDGEATIDLGAAGPARLTFVQKYTIYANLMAAAHYLPCAGCRSTVPFVLAGAGIGFERDETDLTLANTFVYETLEVENHGFFPVFTLGGGVDLEVSRGSGWYVELGAAYYWGRLKHSVAAHGSLAPAPEVTADTDSTGPNWWIGIARRF